MLRSICDKKGMGMIEVVIAIFLTTVGVLAILELQPSAWRTMGRSDHLGRASGILYKTLEENEARIMNPCNAVALGDQAEAAIKVSGQGDVISGDVTYTVNTNIVQGASSSTFVVTVTVTWATSTTGISESLIVNRQELFRFPEGCTNA